MSGADILGVKTVASTVTVNTWYSLSDFIKFDYVNVPNFPYTVGSAVRASGGFIDPSASLNSSWRNPLVQFQVSNEQVSGTSDGRFNYNIYFNANGLPAAGNYDPYLISFESIKVEFLKAGQTSMYSLIGATFSFAEYLVSTNPNQSSTGIVGANGYVPINLTAPITVLGTPNGLSIQAISADKLMNTPLGSAFGQNYVTTPFTFTVTRTGDLTVAETVSYLTTGTGSKPASADDFLGFAFPHGTLSFAAGQASQTLTITLGDNLSEIAQNVGFTVTVTDPAANTASASGNIQDVVAPGVGIIADIANAVYTSSINQVDGYFQYNRDTALDPSVGFNAETFQDGNRLVIAFKGTDAIADFLADGSWASGTPTSFLQSYVNTALAYVQSIAKDHPGADIILTGHSLGAAVAELASAASGYSAIVFNAPGAKQYEAFFGIPQKPTALANVLNYRVAGDQVSLAGTQIGNVITLASTYPDDWANAYTNHQMTTVIKFLGVNHQVATEAPLKLSDLLIGVNLAGMKNLAGIAVGANHLYGLDPSGSSTFTLEEDANSPEIATVEMPPLDGVSSYNVFFSGSSGSTQQTVLPNQVITAPVGTKKVQFTALDSSGNPVVLPSDTVFGVSFATAGTLNATISPITTGTAPGVSTSPVYRFFDTTYGTHLFTQSLSEAQTIVSSRPDLTQETNGFGAVSSSNPSAEAVYRFFETSNGTHFFTASAAEYQGLTTPGTATYRADLTYEASSTFYEDSAQQAGDMPVYRLFDATRGTQFLTGSQSEYSGLITPGSSTYRADLQSEGIAFYAPTGSFHS